MHLVDISLRIGRILNSAHILTLHSSAFLILQQLLPL
jgi:hypothetical protein